jgi:hypothetical protein
MNYEFEEMWKVAIVVCYWYYPGRVRFEVLAVVTTKITVICYAEGGSSTFLRNVHEF